MATSQGASLGFFTKLQLWCQVSIALPYYLLRYCWFCVLTSYQNDWWRHQLSSLHNAKTWISLERKKILKKGKRHCSSLVKTFKMRQSYFLLHMHLNFSSLRVTDAAFSTAGNPHTTATQSLVFMSSLWFLSCAHYLGLSAWVQPRLYGARKREFWDWTISIPTWKPQH